MGWGEKEFYDFFVSILPEFWHVHEREKKRAIQRQSCCMIINGIRVLVFKEEDQPCS